MVEASQDNDARLEIIKSNPADATWHLESLRHMTISLRGELKLPCSIKLTLSSSFLPLRVKRGVVVVTECSIGTTGAHFLLKAKDASLKNLTPDIRISTVHDIEEQSVTNSNLEPSVSVGEVEVSVGSLSAQKNVSKKVSFSSGEALLQGVILNPHTIQWSLRPHAGIKVIAGYLEGNLELDALGIWNGEKLPDFYCQAEPSDRRFFGPDGRVLSLLASMGLLVKLIVEGVELPPCDILQDSLTLRYMNYGK